MIGKPAVNSFAGKSFAMQKVESATRLVLEFVGWNGNRELRCWDELQIPNLPNKTFGSLPTNKTVYDGVRPLHRDW